MSGPEVVLQGYAWNASDRSTIVGRWSRWRIRSQSCVRLFRAIGGEGVPRPQRKRNLKGNDIGIKHPTVFSIAATLSCCRPEPDPVPAESQGGTFHFNFPMSQQHLQEVGSWEACRHTNFVMLSTTTIAFESNTKHTTQAEWSIVSAVVCLLHGSLWFFTYIYIYIQK